MTSVSFRKMVSDGGYGSEVAEVSLEVDVDLIHDEPIEISDVDKAIEDAIAGSLATARRLVHDELRQSPSANVRRALEDPRRKPEPLPVSGVDSDEDEELPY